MTIFQDAIAMICKTYGGNLKLSKQHTDHLIENWSDVMYCLACYATLRVYDTQGPWQCFLIAINPQDQDEVFCIISYGKLQADVETCRLSELGQMYNSHGEPLQIDYEYRPKLAYQILRQLKGFYER